MMDDNGIWSRIEAAEAFLFEGEYDQCFAQLDVVFDEMSAEADAPELLAAALRTRGLCLTELGMLDAAIEDLHRAHRLEADHELPEYESTAQALAAVYDYAGRHERAEELFRELVTFSGREHGNSSAEHGQALAGLGVCLEGQQKFGEAKATLGRAVAVLHQSDPRGHGMDVACNGLGNCAMATGDFDAALHHYTEALKVRIGLVGESHPRVAVVRHNLALALHELGRNADALEHARIAVELRRAQLPADHPWRLASEDLAETLERLTIH